MNKCTSNWREWRQDPPGPGWSKLSSFRVTLSKHKQQDDEDESRGYEQISATNAKENKTPKARRPLFLQTTLSTYPS